MKDYMVNWQEVIDSLTDGKEVTVNPERWNMMNPEYQKMLDLWKAHNFNTNSVKWTNYYKYGDLESTIAKQFYVTPLRSWISCVEPGYMTGPHYDIDDNEQEYLKHGEIHRYSIFISKPSAGQLFILNDKYYYNQNVGTVLKWKHYRDWHNGINGSLEKKYMFHLLGY